MLTMKRLRAESVHRQPSGAFFVRGILDVPKSSLLLAFSSYFFFVGLAPCVGFIAIPDVKPRNKL
eukprot:m.373882 g.373882  ORF g.373882 m.373882 type:complete len:65 (-) comp56155_c1_seq2:18-212(-)